MTGMSDMRQIVLLITIGLILPSCAWLRPQTSALEKVHETYRQEFAELGVIDPVTANRSKGLKPPGDLGAMKAIDAELKARKAQPHPFARTLRAIRDYRVEHAGRSTANTTSKPLAHLNVLEGMIYLQSRQFGLAMAISGDVKKSGEVLKNDSGTPPRDRLFALTYVHLIDGWRQIHRNQSNSGDTNRKTLTAAANGIKAVLGANVPNPNTDPDVDSAASYLAATALIYWVWVHELYAADCALSHARCTPPIKKAVKDKSYYCDGLKLLAPYISESEKMASDGILDQSYGVVTGRLRYVRWYGWLKKRVTDDCKVP